MGKELHIGAGLLVLAATCGRVLMKNGDVAVRNADVLVRGGADVAARNADSLRHLDAAAELRHLDDGGELLKDVALEVAQFTAEQVAELDWGTDDDEDYRGRWQGSWMQGELKVSRFCTRAKRTDVWWLRCREAGMRADGVQAYAADWEGRQFFGEDRICTVVDLLHDLQIKHDTAAVRADFERRVANTAPCEERGDGELAVVVDGVVRAETR